MSELHWFFYDFGALAGISSGVCAAVLMVWTLRGARRSAVYRLHHRADGLPRADDAVHPRHGTHLRRGSEGK